MNEKASESDPACMVAEGVAAGTPVARLVGGGVLVPPAKSRRFIVGATVGVGVLSVVGAPPKREVAIYKG